MLIEGGDGVAKLRDDAIMESFLLGKAGKNVKKFQMGGCDSSQNRDFQQLKCNIQNCLLAGISFIASVSLLTVCAVEYAS